MHPCGCRTRRPPSSPDRTGHAEECIVIASMASPCAHRCRRLCSSHRHEAASTSPYPRRETAAAWSRYGWSASNIDPPMTPARSACSRSTHTRSVRPKRELASASRRITTRASRNDRTPGPPSGETGRRSSAAKASSSAGSRRPRVSPRSHGRSLRGRPARRFLPEVVHSPPRARLGDVTASRRFGQRVAHAATPRQGWGGRASESIQRDSVATASAPPTRSTARRKSSVVTRAWRCSAVHDRSRPKKAASPS